MAAELTSVSPIDGAVLGSVAVTPPEAIAGVVAAAGAAFTRWRDVPAPRRGELVRLFGAELRAEKRRLATLVTLEVGKIGAEAEGEVQEMIDVCDFAVGLSRQLHGLSIASERPGHRMTESWHPLGPCAVISAFNFPVAVWCWNAALALVCGDPVIWKPSEKAPLTAAATLAILARALDRFGADAPPGLVQLVIGGAEQGMALAADGGVALVSATGSTRMGRAVAPVVAARFGRVLLELGGNAAMIVCPSADLELAVRAIVFAAIGTAGQRCTSLRRLIVHRSVAAPLLERLRRAYASIPIGDPRDPAMLLGPLVDEAAAVAMERALDRAVADGGEPWGGGRMKSGVPGGGVYVRPALVRMPRQSAIVREETFAPLLYVLVYDDFDEALRLHNDVPQGLSGCIFTLDLREAERFVSAAGSDCGIANVNIGPSGAEIGGAFGGEKETGGGRESGSDAWKGYMRRQTVTVNFSRDLPLAQGVTFGSGG